MRIQGFSLIELMVVVLLMGIIGAIVYPSYQGYAVETRRRVAQSCLLEIMQWVERYNTKNLTFVDVAPPEMTCQTKQMDFYTIGLSEPATFDTYTLKATAINVQAELDADCVELTINHLNEQTPEDCW